MTRSPSVREILRKQALRSTMRAERRREAAAERTHLWQHHKIGATTKEQSDSLFRPKQFPTKLD